MNNTKKFNNQKVKKRKAKNVKPIDAKIREEKLRIKRLKRKERRKLAKRQQRTPEPRKMTLTLPKINNVNPRRLRLLKQILDPFHDTVIDPIGWPDFNSQHSVIRRIPIEITISKPPISVNFPDGQWNVYIVFQPWMNPILFGRRTRSNNYIDSVVPGSTTLIGNVMVYGTPLNTEFSYGNQNNPTGGNPTVPLLATLCPPPDVFRGPFRVVGGGLEVENITAELFRSGSITAWCAPEPQQAPSTMYIGTSVGTQPVIVHQPTSVQFLTDPPDNPGEARYYPSTISWDAAEGVYMPFRFHDTINPASKVSYVMPVMISDDQADDMPTWQSWANTATTPMNENPIWVPMGMSQSSPIRRDNILPATKIEPMNQMGVMLTGLTKETSLRVRVVYYIETLPASNQIDIVTLAKVMNPPDDKLMQLVIETQAKMPIATKFTDNPLGEWWKKVMATIRVVAPAVGLAFGLPEVGMAAAGLATALEQL